MMLMVAVARVDVVGEPVVVVVVLGHSKPEVGVHRAVFAFFCEAPCAAGAAGPAGAAGAAGAAGGVEEVDDIGVEVSVLGAGPAAGPAASPASICLL